MINKRVELSNATEEDYEEYFGNKSPHSFRAIVGKVDGEILGLGGIMHRNIPTAFYDVKDPATSKKYRRDLIIGTHMVMDMAQRHYAKIYGLAQDDDIAPIFLIHFGFEFLKNTNAGEVWVWHKQ